MEKSVEQNFTSDKWRVATTADWSYWCSMFLMSASFRTIELWPSAPIYKQRDAEQLLQQLLERPGASISLSKPQPASIYCLFIQKKKNPPKPEEVAPSALLKFSSISLHQAERRPCPVSHTLSDRVSHSPHASTPQRWSSTHGIRTKSSGKDLG